MVIIGGGVIGTSVAWHLATMGCRNIRVLDAATEPGTGSTGRATGGYRATFGTTVNVRLSLLTRRKLLAFREETGGDAGYAPVGYLWIARSASELRELSEGLPVQHAEGLTESCVVDAEEVRRINPALAPDGIAGGVFCPSDGYIRPRGILDGYRAAAERMGVRFAWGERITALARKGDRITGVVTTAGPVPCDLVVNAAGAWAAAVAALAGATLPVVPLRRQIVPTAPTAVLPSDMPMTLFAGDGFHLRVRDGRVLLAWPTPGNPADPFDVTVEEGWVPQVLAFAHARVPVLRDVAVSPADAWGGLYEESPDRHAILGPAPECPNLFLVNGSSGHGVMHAPALGQLAAELITGCSPTLDVRQLRPSRFAEGDAMPVHGLL